MTSTSPVRVLFFGMRCSFSAPPLKALIEAGHYLVAVTLPGAPFAPSTLTRPRANPIPLAASDQPISTIDDIIARASAPILTLGDPSDPDAISMITDLYPDVIAVACFPRLVPPEILSIPRLGGLNVHPSLLPRGRGPEPLFWTFRRGESETGVTIHLMNDHFDAGPILLQERVPVPAGIRLPTFERHLAELGGTLLIKAIEQLATGRATPIPQNDAGSTSAPTPAPADFDVPTDLPARWAYNFVRAVAPTIDRLNVVVLATKQEIAVVDAISFSENETPSVPVQLQEKRAVVAFQPGSVTFALPDLDQPAELTASNRL